MICFRVIGLCRLVFLIADRSEPAVELFILFSIIVSKKLYDYPLKGYLNAASRFLADHTNISKAHGEPNFVNIDENYAKGFAWYSSQFKYTEVGTLRFEKTPSYYKSIDAQMGIQKMNPNIKMVLVGMKN